MMKRLITVVAVLSIALLGRVAFCQDATGIPDEIIKELDGLVGNWKVEGKVGDKKQTGSCTIRWVLMEDKKCCLIGRGSYTTDGKTQNVVSLLGWNAATKCIEDRGFDSDGGSGILCWTVKSPGKWRGVLRIVANGQEVKSESDFIVKGPSEIVMECESQAGEMSRFVFTKDKEASKQKAKR